MTDREVRKARIIGYARLHPTKSLLQVARDLGYTRWMVYRDVAGMKDIRERVIIRKQRRVTGESIVDATWLHTWDILVNIETGRRVMIQKINYLPDLTRTFELKAIDGVSRSSLASMLTLKQHYYRAVTGETRIA